MKLRALRGAITVDENERDAILDRTEELVHAVMERNSLDAGDIVSCIFTCTDDLDAAFPAEAARRLGPYAPVHRGLDVAAALESVEAARGRFPDLPPPVLRAP